MSLSKRAEEFQQYLTQNFAGRGLDFTVVELPDSTRTAQEAADAIATTLKQIVKSLIFKNSKTGLPVLVLASGQNRVNEKSLAKLLGADPVKADAAFVKEMTGFTIGGVPPLGHKIMGEVFVDRDLLGFDEIWAAAGTPHAVFRITDPATTLPQILAPHTIIDLG